MCSSHLTRCYLNTLIMATATGALVTVLCGMVGSPGGAAFYRIYPPSIAVATGRALSPTDRVHPLPSMDRSGVSGTGHAGNYDVMRGEEVQFFGAQQLRTLRTQSSTVTVFPRHPQWIDASSSTLNNFSTTMSGELFGYSQLSILASSVDGDAPWNDTPLRVWTTPNNPVACCIIYSVCAR